MSIKTMVTKLALAFAAKKGLNALNKAGGISGIADALQSRQDGSAVLADINGPRGNSASVKSLLDDLSNSGSNTHNRGARANPMNASLGSLLATLANTFGQISNSSVAARDLDNAFGGADVTRDLDATSPIVRAMVQAARADETIDQREQAALLDMLSDANADERETLDKALNEPVDPDKLARETPNHVRKEVYSAALLIAEPTRKEDGAFLTRLAKGLGLSQGDIDTLHSVFGKHGISVA